MVFWCLVFELHGKKWLVDIYFIYIRAIMGDFKEEKKKFITNKNYLKVTARLSLRHDINILGQLVLQKS